jgi:hypothetical protein
MSSKIPILQEISRERIRQNEKWGEQNHPIINEGEFDLFHNYGIIDEETAKTYCEDGVKDGDLCWANILVEEVSEALCAPNKELMREELVQCAAVIVAMIESLDRNGK